MKQKIFHSFLISISFVKRVSKPVTLYNSYCNIEKYYCLLLKLISKFSNIYISFIIYTNNYHFYVLVYARAFGLNYFLFLVANSV